MNKDRRDRIAKIKEALEDLRGQIEDLQTEEQEAFDNMPESLQQSERGQASEAAADALHGALSQYPRVVHAKRLEVVDERTLDAPEPGGW